MRDMLTIPLLTDLQLSGLFQQQPYKYSTLLSQTYVDAGLPLFTSFSFTF